MYERFFIRYHTKKSVLENDYAKFGFKIPEEIISLDVDKIDLNNHDAVKKIIVLQHNVIESLLMDRQQILEYCQKLIDELNRLKGEKGKPEIKPNVSTRKLNFFPL